MNTVCLSVCLCVCVWGGMKRCQCPLIEVLITTLATTIHTGDPMAVPCTYAMADPAITGDLETKSVKELTFAFVLPGREGSSSSHAPLTLPYVSGFLELLRRMLRLLAIQDTFCPFRELVHVRDQVPKQPLEGCT